MDIEAQRQKFKDSIDIGSEKWGKLCRDNQEKNLFCICGHLIVWHFRQRTFCGGIADIMGPLCNCLEFKPRDNLAYVEYLANNKGLI